MQTIPTTREMERAVLARDSSYDALFFVAVRTTGIFCRPSCPARKPLPGNMEYFGSPGEALRAGYRPCKRCHPLETNGQPPDWVARIMSRVEQQPDRRVTDGELRSLSIDPARARRYFHKHFGMTFHAYQRSLRLGASLTQIRNGADLTDVGLGNGYHSTSGFRDAFAKTFGRTPGSSRLAECVLTQVIESPVGPLIIAATAAGLCLLEFVDRRALEAQFAVLRRRLDCSIVPGKNEHIERAIDELARYFAGTLYEFTVPLAVRGTPFQQAVWEALGRIPYGQTRSYEKIAKEVGQPSACRAVGRANGDNRIAIVIPCHRVVRSDGTLGGYGGGLWRKQFLLDLERGQTA